MKYKLIFLILFVCTILNLANGQSTIDQLLSEIEKNNKTIKKTAQYFEAQNLAYKTGLTPKNPEVEYDFLIGHPSNAGNQHEVIVKQQFDFPSAYKKKSQLSKLQIRLSEFEMTAILQDILLEAKKICIALVFQYKMKNHINRQKKYTENLVYDFQLRLEKGEGNILELNKGRLQLIEINKALRENESDITGLKTKLAALNGGIEPVFTDSAYSLIPAVPEFTQLEKEYKNADPVLKKIGHQLFIFQKQLELSKTLRLPKMELGYRYQGNSGLYYSGVHTGISIPIWEHKNIITQNQAQLLFSEMQLEAHLIDQYHNLKRTYDRYENLKIILQDYQGHLKIIDNTILLKKALAQGEITSIEYFNEINHFNDAIIDFLKTEKEYNEVVAELFKYQL